MTTTTPIDGLAALHRIAVKIRDARKRERDATSRDAREKAQQDVHAYEARFFDDWSLLQTMASTPKEVTTPKEST